MNLNVSIHRKEKLEKATHILAGVIILFHAYEKYEGEHSSYIYFVIAGAIFLSIAIFHHQLKLKFPWIDNCFFIIEAISSLNYIFICRATSTKCSLFFFQKAQKIACLFIKRMKS